MDASMSIPSYLVSDDCSAANICYGNCATPVKQNPESGNWYITMSHPGFNSPANNRNGYKSNAAALAALKRYGRK